MTKFLFIAFVSLLSSPVIAGEFRETAMCDATHRSADFPRLSIQRFPGDAVRGLLILSAADGWTQVYSGPIKETATELTFREDEGTIEARFDKNSLLASTTFNKEVYRCDKRSFGD